MAMEQKKNVGIHSAIRLHRNIFCFVLSLAQLMRFVIKRTSHYNQQKTLFFKFISLVSPQRHFIIFDTRAMFMLRS